MRNNKTDGIEKRIPASECGRDSSPQGKDSRRVSWNVAENHAFLPSGHETTPNDISEPSDECVAELSFDVSSKKSSILQPTLAPSSTIETEEIETNQISDCQPSIERAIPCATPNNASKSEGCAKTMDRKILHFHSSEKGPMNTMSLGVEEPIVIKRNLLQKVSKLQQAILSIRKHDSAQKGKFLVREYQLRAELEVLCEDVIFLGEKRKRLAETLRELRVKNAEIQRSESIGEDSNDANIGNISDHRSNSNEDKVEEQETGVSDASVQTEDWQPNVVDRPLTPTPGFTITPRPIAPTTI